MVYAFGDETGTIVKIGSSSDPDQRLKRVRHEPLYWWARNKLFVAPECNIIYEGSVHTTLNPWRAFNEAFYWTPEVRALLAAIHSDREAVRAWMLTALTYRKGRLGPGVTVRLFNAHGRHLLNVYSSRGVEYINPATAYATIEVTSPYSEVLVSTGLVPACVNGKPVERERKYSISRQEPLQLLILEGMPPAPDARLWFSSRTPGFNSIEHNCTLRYSCGHPTPEDFEATDSTFEVSSKEAHANRSAE